jgi:hypothetical protein
VKDPYQALCLLAQAALHILPSLLVRQSVAARLQTYS